MRIPPRAAKRDSAVGTVHDTYWDEHKEIARGKSLLLVEGDDDLGVVETFLERRSPTFSTRVHVVSAGGRKKVLKRLKSTFPQGTHPNAYGLVDRDTWTDAEVIAEKAKEPRLYVTDGWCLENAFLTPDALRLCGAGVEAQVAGQREPWVRAGALWWALQRTREAQQKWQEALGWSYGFLKPDLDLSSAKALAESLKGKIPEDLRREATLDVDFVAAAFARRCDEIFALGEAKQWQIGVHGKCAFEKLLVPQGSTPRGRLLELAEDLACPPPLDELVDLLLSTSPASP